MYSRDTGRGNSREGGGQQQRLRRGGREPPGRTRLHLLRSAPRQRTASN